MKNLNLQFGRFVALIAIMFTVSVVKANDLDNSVSMNNFHIKEVSSIDTNALNIWELNYGNINKGVHIEKNFTNNGTEYIVRGEFFEVRYVNNKNGFGVREIQTRNAKVNEQISYAVIDQKQMENQRIISPKGISDEKALNLIASYLPDLVRNNYKHILR
ncbi:hypothetical protein K5X82_07475 [Halosquirtibacter xylanolyticus]|uniref:hypothetical protein n=1 Tax=Halosquirtibacter xylanolyticus TaxID=3374599 RepID=UPI003747F01D|nr:hypothetical protein K5X82_07475 [Prolixibacteraceae bacterium]